MTAGQTVWLFRPEAMQLGDIVLERGASPKAGLIAGATGGQYSHALLWVGNDFVEAMPEGVRSLSFARVPVLEPGNWLLLRPRPEQSRFAEMAVVHARSMTFKEYDTAGAIRTVFGPRRKPLPTRRFCSQLVVEAYGRSGLDLLPGKRPEAVTPNMLAESRHLQSIELPLMNSEEAQKGPYPSELLDRSKAYLASGMHREAETNRALFRLAQPMLKDCAPVAALSEGPGNLGELLDCLMLLRPEDSFPIADALLAEMNRLGYFDFLVPQMAGLMQRVHNTPHWNRQIPMWEQSRQRHAENQQRCMERFSAMPHPIWMRLAAMYAVNTGAFEGLIELAST